MTTTLNKLVGTILKDLAKAQDTSNKYSALLSREYKDTDSELHSFLVPNALFDEAEFDIKYAYPPQGTETQKQKDYDRIESILKKVAKDMRIALSDAFVYTVDKIFEGNENSDDPAINAALADWKIIKENLYDNNFAKSLTNQITYQLSNKIVSILDEDNQLLPAKVFEALNPVLEEYLLQHPEIHNLFKHSSLKSPSSEEIFQKVAQDFDWTVYQKELSLSFTEVDPDREIIIDAEQLSNLPEKAIDHVRIKVRLTGYKWEVVGNTNNKQFLVPVDRK